jgi:alpha,alpha-trehalase
MRVVFHGDGIISQFEGYDRLEEFDWKRARRKHGDIQGGTTPEGIHLGAMAGVVDLVQRCYTEIQPRDDVLWFHPRLPEEIRSIRMNIRYRDQSLQIRVGKDRLKIRSLRSEATPILIGVESKVYELKAGEEREFKL